MESKTVRFTLYGNRIFNDDSPPNIILEDVSMCLADYKGEKEEIEASDYYFEHPTTLRDIAVLLFKGCGQGVMWQLSKELSKELNISENYVQKVVDKIVYEYANLSEQDAIEKYEELAVYIDTENI